MTEPRRAYVLRPNEGRDIDMGNFRMSLKASGEDSEQAFSILEAEEPPHFGPPMHIHHDAAEAFYIVSGEYVIFIENEEHLCAAGSFIFIPAGVPHGFRVGAVPSRKLNIYAPAAMVGYFDDLAAAIARNEMDDDTLTAIARRHGMEVIGPVPEKYV
jgi:mannose-6-phosphate isomerase-like protein (cupin superfamily)